MLLLVAASGASFGGWYFLARKNVDHSKLILHPVKKEKLQVTITERGGLEAAENIELTCQVKARTQGGAATTIRWVIDNGSIVKKGDKLIELDDSYLQDQLTAQQITAETARGAWLTAEEQFKIVQSTNEGAIATQALNIEVGQITLAEYESGLYQQTRTDLAGKLTMSKSDLAMWEERAAWSDRMSRPGRQFVTVSQAEADHARLLSARITRENLEKQLDVLDNLTLKKTALTMKGTIDEARRALERARLSAKATEVQSGVDRDVKQMTYNKELARLRDIEKEIDRCTIKAPQDGMVVYYVEERARYSQSSAGVIAQGETVKEGQKLMSIPNLERMVVNARVHEAMVSRVKADVNVETGFSEVVNTVMAVNPDPLSAITAYAAFITDQRTPFINEHRRAEKKRVARGLDAIVRVNAFPDKQLKGHVKYLATVASQNDFFASDVKVYQTYIAVDESLQGLKPGMDAVVTIFVDSAAEPVLAVPLQAVLGTVDMGHKRKCFVVSPDGGPQMRDITLGMANEKLVEIKDGLEEGEVIVLNPAVLLTEKERIEYGTMPVQTGRGGPGAPGDKGGRQGKNKGKDKGGPPGAGMEGGGPPGAGMQGGGMRGGPGGRQGKGGGNWQGKGGSTPPSGGAMPAGGGGGGGGS